MSGFEDGMENHAHAITAHWASAEDGDCSTLGRVFEVRLTSNSVPDSKVYGANMGPTWGRQDPGGPHVGPMNLVIWVESEICLNTETAISSY